MNAPRLTLAALQAMCSESRPNIMTPFGVMLDDAAWTVATDGMRLLAVRHDYGMTRDGTPNGNVMRDALTLIRGGTPVDIAPLREFFAAHGPAPVGACPECNDKHGAVCDECGGNGEVDCECECGDVHTKDCEACNGSGDETCKRCADRDDKVCVRVGSVTYDARLMSPLFRLLPEGDACFVQQGPERMSVIGGVDWFAALMPLRSDRRDVPTLDLTTMHARAA